MFDSQCDLAALVYKAGEHPDEILLNFSNEVIASGYRAVGMVQLDRSCVDSPKLSAMLVHNKERLQLFQDLGACSQGCKLDVGRLLNAGAEIAEAIDQGADVLIINRYGRQECEGKGLLYLIERALSAEIPVVIAVPESKFSNWIEFSGGMSVKLRCRPDSLDAWWDGVSDRNLGRSRYAHRSVCEVFK